MKTKSPLALALLVAACGPSTLFKDSEIPTLPKLDDVMWSQAQVMDPQFKKIGQPSYAAADFAAMSAAGARLKLTTAKIKESFSKGPEFNQFADTLAAHAAELVDAAGAQDAAKASAALAAAKSTCKACHSKFK